ncbi:MAG: divergent PAP2 family protein [bacterium]
MITPYLYVPLLAWLIAQLIKTIIEIIKGDADVRYLYASGGMPSAHSAVVCSLAGYTFYNQGIGSPLFGITAIIAGIVMYDSFGVRRSAGEQARTLNTLIAEMARTGNLRKPDEYGQLREILGHQPLEVIVGAILGGLVATLFSLNQLSPIINWLTASPSKLEIKVIFGIGVSMIVLSLGIFAAYKKKIKKDRELKKINTYFQLSNICLGITLLLAGLLANESILPYGQRWLAVAIMTVWALLMLIAIWRMSNLRKIARFSSPDDDSSKKAWLKKAGKKK